MKKFIALVTAVNPPVVACLPGQAQVTVAYMAKGYKFTDESGDEIIVPPKKKKREVFTNYWPKIGDMIEVGFV